VIFYRIKDWSIRFENNRTRELKKLDWVPTPNRHDGDGYTTLLSYPNGEALFGAWNAILQVASRCSPLEGATIPHLPAGWCGGRGVLIRDSGKPHDAASIAARTRFSEATIIDALNVCSSDDVGWLERFETMENTNESKNLAPSCGKVAVKPQPLAEIPQEGITEGKGREGNINTVAPLHVVQKKFQRPTQEEVKLQAAKIGLPDSEAEKFWNFYESKGWLVGKSPMKSWQAAMITWRGNWQERGGVRSSNGFTTQHQPTNLTNEQKLLAAL
jgi:hypothetical protein